MPPLTINIFHPSFIWHIVLFGFSYLICKRWHSEDEKPFSSVQGLFALLFCWFTSLSRVIKVLQPFWVLPYFRLEYFVNDCETTKSRSRYCLHLISKKLFNNKFNVLWSSFSSSLNDVFLLLLAMLLKKKQRKSDSSFINRTNNVSA